MLAFGACPHHKLGISMYFSSIDTTLAKVVLNTYKKSLVAVLPKKNRYKDFGYIYDLSG
jgi:hypothetical protein